jgi:hypothetical protein
MDAVLTVSESEQLENNEGENDRAQKQEGQGCSRVFGWGEGI